jgi:predicted alpha/beta hydrolase
MNPENNADAIRRMGVGPGWERWLGRRRHKDAVEICTCYSDLASRVIWIAISSLTIGT